MVLPVMLSGAERTEVETSLAVQCKIRDSSTSLGMTKTGLNPMNLNKLMKQAQKMQEQMAKTQAELESKTVEVTAAGGKVKVTANGAGDILAIKMDKEVVDPNDVEFLEEIVLSAVQQAVEQGKALAQSEMSKLTGGLGL
jgi:nucleoid-associated protein EbfC